MSKGQNMFESVEKAIYEIKTLILTEPNIRKLLVIDSLNALEEQAPTVNEAREHILLAPVFDITEPPYDKNTTMTIVLSKAVYDDEAVLLNGMVKINILTRTELWQLNNEKIRPLEIVNLIVKRLNNQKVSVSHKLFFKQIDIAILNENVSGYTIIFHMEEGSGLDEQF